MTKKIKSIVLTSFPFIFYGLLLLFLYFYVRSLDFTKLAEIEMNWWYIALATLFGLAFRYWGTFIWFVLLRGLGATEIKDTVQLIYVYAKSWLGRYIPGTAPWILGKIYFASKYGISKNKLAVSSLLEGALQIVVLLGLSFAMLIFDTRLDVIEPVYKVLMLGVLVLCFVALTPAVFNRITSIGYRLIRKKEFDREHWVNGKTVAIGAGLYVVGATLSGLSFFFIAKALYPELGYQELFYIIGATNLASAVSMLIIFAPSGIGVREGIMLLLLSVVMPAEIALLITIVMRVWSIAVDFLFFGLSKLLTLKRKPTEAL